ncbi:MAG: four helix bundle protein, partial [Minisyncoccia bacterium]
MEENNSRDYKQSAIWQKSIELVFAIQRLMGFFPNLENYGSISQIRKFSVTISKNIAEGKKMSEDKKAYFQALVGA